MNFIVKALNGGMMLPEDGGALPGDSPGDAPEPPEDGPKRGGHLRVVK